MRHRRGQTRALALTTIAALAVSCAPTAADTPSRLPSFQANAGAGGSAARGPANSAGQTASFDVDNPMRLPLPAGNSAADTAGTGADAGIVDASAMSDAPLTSDNACGKGKAEAKLKPVNMFVMFDRSGSMDDDDKWTDASAALTAFFQDPAVAGIRVALRFFPHDRPVDGCSDDDCDPVACSQPLVPLGELSANAAPLDTQERALVEAVASSEPGGDDRGGGTPIHAALDGALRWATTYSVLHADESTVVVFVTDGEPNGCNEDFDDIAALASTTLKNTGVTTYAIGLKGSNADQMDQLAQAGGTMQSILIGVGASAEQELLTALNRIRGQAFSCDFPMPESTDSSMMIDPSKVNVTFTPGAGQTGTLAQVPDENACSTNKSWFYDVPQKPTRIHLCPAACELVRADSKAVLEILLGCATACGGLDVSCGGTPPPAEIPPIVL